MSFIAELERRNVIFMAGHRVGAWLVVHEKGTKGGRRKFPIETDIPSGPLFHRPVTAVYFWPHVG